MNLGIAFSPDPVYMTPFIQKLVEKHSSDMKLVICTQGSITKKKSLGKQLDYFFALLLILGIPKTVSNAWKVLTKKKTSLQELQQLCERHHIRFLMVKTINSNTAITAIKEAEIDVLFNQSQHIVRANVLAAPKIAVINRHGALLPKYRGRLAPFWQLYNKEETGGITFHILDENIDNGPIIVQQAIPLSSGETVSSLIDKMFTLALELYGKSLILLSNPDFKQHLLPNDEKEATYYGSPTLRDALKFTFRK